MEELKIYMYIRLTHRKTLKVVGTHANIAKKNEFGLFWVTSVSFTTRHGQIFLNLSLTNYSAVFLVAIVAILNVMQNYS